jgi:photosystem II stability/assembly factor-like uncharacterized protein
MDWYIATKKEIPNYDEVRYLYNTYFKTNPLEKSSQRNLVRRWLSIYIDYRDENGDVIFDQPGIEDYSKIKNAEKGAKQSWLSKKNTSNSRATSPPPNGSWNDSTGTWRMIGPYHSAYVPGVYSMFGGFNDRVYVNPYNSKNMFAGQSYGGLWVSKDAGATWKLTDAEFPNGKNTYANRDMYYGEIEAHPSNANRIMACTEAGLLISNNGGESWTMDGTLNHMNISGTRSYFLASQPNDSDVMLVSYGKVIYRTNDGGTNWNVVFDNSSVSHTLSTGQHGTIGVYHRWYNFFGLEFHPTANNIVYLGALNAADEACIYKSNDSGLSFSLLVNTANTDWLKMMISPADPDHIYLANLFINANAPNIDEGVYKIDTSGSPTQFIPAISAGQGQLLDDFIISPNNANTWYYGGYASGAVWKSINAGTSWTSGNPGYVNWGNYVHPDVRALSVVNDTLLIGSDGGLHISFDAGQTFNAAGDFISGIDQWGFSSAYKGEILASGDDHGPTEIRTRDADRSWRGIGGADSGEIQINRCNTDYMYGRDVYTRFLAVRTSDSTYSRMSNALVDAKYEYLCQDPDEYFTFYPIQGSDLMFSSDNMKTATLIKSFPLPLTKVEVALLNKQIIYVLEDNRLVHKSTDGGTNWIVITPPGSVTNGRTNISDIAIDETGENIWLSYGQTQTSCKAVHSGNGGSSWTNITTPALPGFASSNIAYQRGTYGMVYMATNGGGIWYKSLSDSDWSILGQGLPSMGYVQTIYTVPDLNKFRMGSSRGAFEHALPVTSDVWAHFSVQSKQTTSCVADTAYFFDYSSYFDNGSITFTWTFEGGSPATSNDMNPKVTYAEPGIFDVSLTIEDGSGGISTITREDFMMVEQSKCDITTVPGKAMRNTDNYNYVQAPSPQVQNTQNYTMTAWIKGEGTQRDYAGILSLVTSTGNVHLNLRSAAASAEIGYHHPNGQWWWSSGLYLNPNEWTHVALVVEPTGITVYKNGIGAKHTRSVVASDLTEKFVIGTMINREGDRCFNGLIDEVTFYNKSLTQNEIRKMMHLTKQNPNYADQFDANLVAYYQFNEEGAVIYDYSGNNRTASLVGNSIIKISSDGPFGGGRAEMVEVLASAQYDFTEPGVSISFPGPIVPNGQIVVSHVQNKPDTLPKDVYVHEEGYYIIHNFGTNTSFDPLSTISFSKTGTISNEIAINGGGFSIWKRPSFAHDVEFLPVLSSNISLVAGNIGTVIANDASPITNFSQFIIARDPYPIGHPKVRMVTPEKAGIPLIGGESISLYMDSDNQGFLLPSMTDQELNNAGTPINGMMVYSKSQKEVIVFQGGFWTKLKSKPLLNLMHGAFNGEVSISFGDGTSGDSSAIVNMLEKGFVKYASLTNTEIPGIKYPVEGLLIYNSDVQSLQYFNGTNWVNFQIDMLPFTTSTDPATEMKGFAIGNSISPNATLEDGEITGGILIPTLEATMIKTPVEGLFIYDETKRAFLFFNGVFWSELVN